ncbi:MAG: biopolymer transporter ExbD [candidate division KSB1 bacterium]|nr:biopolymer transporter ExbD [candidate division KSB1 bacterium]MDZ7334593.1 biopolymer transporter ExbD [candidate division KSB1 bacterium]MDZ7356600.1 biopolymer transporter ExbD [candidate division KSB1 bacterium]MDZ7375724.1 biopolymer transporter ExbD [candidate division KSB1 bacterium]MDZ7399917.1 biopolymer transporter ExbD [candidate division KSB1 bacterium]
MQFHEKKRRKVIINITSLIDVMFLLLIFFMVSSTFIEQPGMKLELPESKSATVEQIKELVLEITAEQRMLLNQDPVSIENLESKIKQLLPNLAENSLVLKADRSVPHGMVVKVMDIAKLSGIEKLVIATRPIDE